MAEKSSTFIGEENDYKYDVLDDDDRVMLLSRNLDGDNNKMHAEATQMTFNNRSELVLSPESHEAYASNGGGNLGQSTQFTKKYLSTEEDIDPSPAKSVFVA